MPVVGFSGSVQTRFQGRVWLFGDDISTDHIISGKYLGSMDPKALAEHAMEAVDPGFSKKVRAGAIASRTSIATVQRITNGWA